jgi:hypothetical protein
MTPEVFEEYRGITADVAYAYRMALDMAPNGETRSFGIIVVGNSLCWATVTGEDE